MQAKVKGGFVCVFQFFTTGAEFSPLDFHRPRCNEHDIQQTYKSQHHTKFHQCPFRALWDNLFTSSCFFTPLWHWFKAEFSSTNHHNKSRVPNQNGVSQAWYIVEIHHSGREPSKFNPNWFIAVECMQNLTFSFLQSVKQHPFQLKNVGEKEANRFCFCWCWPTNKVKVTASGREYKKWMVPITVAGNI